jgi:Protein of unknown function (DUF3617)
MGRLEFYAGARRIICKPSYRGTEHPDSQQVQSASASRASCALAPLTTHEMRVMPQPMKLAVVAGILLGAFSLAVAETSRQVVAAAPQQGGYDAMPHLDLKPGLWELAVHISTVRPRTIVDTSELEKQLEKLSPEERKRAIANAQLAADQSRELSAKGSGNKNSQCLTAKSFAANELLKMNAQSGCKRTVTSSAQKVSIQYSCPKQSGTYTSEASTTLERINSENIKLTGQTVNVGEQPATATTVITGKFIREECAAPKTATQLEQDKRLAESPIAAANERHGNNYESAVTNRTDKVITAFTIFVQMYGAGQVRSHIYDAATLVSGPLKPHATIREGQPGIVVDVKPQAVIFADGSTWGGPKEVESMMQRRVVRLKTLKAIGASLCDSQRKKLTPEEAAEALEANQKLAPKEADDLLIAVERKAYDGTINYMRVPRKSGKASIADTLKALQVDASALADDPVKDANGKLYISKADAQLPCGGGQ